MKKAELEDALAKALKSNARYKKNSKKLTAEVKAASERIADLERNLDRFLEKIEKQKKDEDRRLKKHRSDQKKLFDKHLKNEAPSRRVVRVEEDRAEVLLEQCQKSNAALREENAALKFKLNEPKN